MERGDLLFMPDAYAVNLPAFCYTAVKPVTLSDSTTGFVSGTKETEYGPVYSLSTKHHRGIHHSIGKSLKNYKFLSNHD